ncbi:MAG TPA: Uma2 family endonuclease [Planctomycetaceae bacterium]|nr:Uma2 family endonuclease [Planctomycetaceae bacterium]
MSTVLEQPAIQQADVAVDADFYEVVHGRRVEIPRMGVRETLIANALARRYWQQVGTRRSGDFVIEVLFELAPGLKRRPDCAFVPFDRWPAATVAAGDSWNLAPSLAVEIVSPTNTADEIQGKIEDYLSYGVDLVWVVYPSQRKVYVYRDTTAAEILDDAGVLDGGDAVPGFNIAVADLFACLSIPEDHANSEPP